MRSKSKVALPLTGKALGLPNCNRPSWGLASWQPRCRDAASVQGRLDRKIWPIQLHPLIKIWTLIVWVGQVKKNAEKERLHPKVINQNLACSDCLLVYTSGSAPARYQAFFVSPNCATYQSCITGTFSLGVLGTRVKNWHRTATSHTYMYLLVFTNSKYINQSKPSLWWENVYIRNCPISIKKAMRRLPLGWCFFEIILILTSRKKSPAHNSGHHISISSCHTDSLWYIGTSSGDQWDPSNPSPGQSSSKDSICHQPALAALRSTACESPAP